MKKVFLYICVLISFSVSVYAQADNAIWNKWTYEVSQIQGTNRHLILDYGVPYYENAINWHRQNFFENDEFLIVSGYVSFIDNKLGYIILTNSNGYNEFIIKPIKNMKYAQSEYINVGVDGGQRKLTVEELKKWIKPISVGNHYHFMGTLVRVKELESDRLPYVVAIAAEMYQ